MFKIKMHFEPKVNISVKENNLSMQKYMLKLFICE